MRNCASELHLANDMHAIYCAFAEDGGYVYVKVGISVVPAKRARQVVHGSPFDIKRFVFCHIGGMGTARSFEKLLKHAMREYNTRGEWFRFKPEMSAEFKRLMAVCYRKAIGYNRKIKWSELPYDTYHGNPFWDLAKARQRA